MKRCPLIGQSRRHFEILQSHWFNSNLTDYSATRLVLILQYVKDGLHKFFMFECEYWRFVCVSEYNQRLTTRQRQIKTVRNPGAGSDERSLMPTALKQQKNKKKYG